MEYQKITEAYKYNLRGRPKTHQNLQQYKTDESGRVIVDFNSENRILAIPLLTETNIPADFNNVVDCDFKEFTTSTNVNANLNLINNELQYYKELNLQNQQLNKQLQQKIRELEGKVILATEIKNLENINNQQQTA